MANDTFMAPGAFDAEAEQIRRRLKYAESLRQMQDPLQGQMVSGHYVAPSWTQGLANIVTARLGKQKEESALNDFEALGDKRRQETLAEALKISQAMNGTPAMPTGQSYETGANEMGDDSATVPQWQGAQAGNRQQALALMLGSRNPMFQQIGAKMMLTDPESNFAKVDAKDYTPESIALFAKTHNHADLVPVRKNEYVSAGGVTYSVNPYTNQVGPVFEHTIKPDTQAQLGWDWYKFNNLSPYQQRQLANEGARIGIDRANLYFNTGMTGMGGGAPSGMPGGAGGMGAGMPPVVPPVGNPAPTRPVANQVPAQTPVPSAPKVVPPSASAVTPKKRAEWEAERPHATQSFNAVRIGIDNSLRQIDALEKSPGLSNITGPVAGRTWNMTGKATNAQADLDTLKSQIGVQVLTAMREASKTGGAVGSVTEKEWPILQNQLGALQQSQTTEQFKKNLEIVRQTLQRTLANAQQAYESIYGAAPQIPNAGANGDWSNSQPAAPQATHGFRVVR